jgi:hypothetical protein
MDIHAVHRKVGARFRANRMRAFEVTFRPNASTRVLDVGGTPQAWDSTVVRPDLTLVNLPVKSFRQQSFPGMRPVAADACALPFRDKAFPIGYSNSTIEHVGTRERQWAFAHELRRVSDTYWVQTPNRWFPIEPHYLTPFVHWVPKPVRVRLLRRCTVWGWMTKPNSEQCRESVAEIRLLTAGEMARLFPEARIVKERVLGLPKSLIAVYDGNPSRPPQGAPYDRPHAFP